MRHISAQQIASGLDFSDFISALRDGFRSDIIAPIRHHHTIEKPRGNDSTLLLMPAWSDFSGGGDEGKKYIGVKLVTVSPDNAAINKASVQAVYLLSNGESGEPLALIDGQALTFWRTSCASALASQYLSRQNASSLLMVGAGALAPWLVRAHYSVRAIEEIRIWNHNRDKAQGMVEILKDFGIESVVETDLQKGVEASDIISAATLSTIPLIKGQWLKAGTHVDLVGGFTPAMREADDGAIKICDLFADTIEGASKEAGDITQPLENGLIGKNDILADLFDLTRERHVGRAKEDQITLFKSVGTPLEDLAAAILVAERIH